MGILLSRRIVIAFTFAVSLGLVRTAWAETIRVSAAISLKEALTDVAAAYQAACGDKVELVFGSSGQLATQIKSGGEVDVFISAAAKQVDDLTKEGLLDDRTSRTV